MTIQVGLLVFPNVQQLDLTGPYEMFASAPGTKVHLIWKDLAPVMASTGLALTPTVTFADCPQLDVICIPGGAGVNPLLHDDAVLDFVRRQAAHARYVTSVCTGSLVLGAAGLLRGKRATSHWNARDLLARFGATPVNARVVRDGNIFTAGGVTAGIDFGLTVVAELFGAEVAQAVQLQLEYAPDPPFDAGTPERAPPQILADVKAKLRPSRKAREDLIATFAAAK